MVGGTQGVEAGELQPIGTGDFGDIYDQFRGKPKEAVDFLIKKKGGDLLGVFHRDEVGDIDLVWGESHNPYKGKGLSHIIRKHIDTLHDFKDIDDLSDKLDDVVNNGNVGYNGNNIEITKDGYRVVLAQENDGKKWILTAFDNSKTKKEKLSSVNTPGTPIDNSGSRAVAADDASLSEGKDTNNISNDQENIGKTSSPEEIAQEEAKVDTNPTEGQKEAGNYQKGHINVDGYDITIENPKGSVRSGVDSKGNRWETTMHNTYGYIRGTEGVDGDHIDVFLSDNPASGSVFVVDQVNPESGAFDEHKVMYGFASEEEAREAYLSNYSEGWQGLGAITEVSREEFKKWVESSHRKTKPFAEYKSVKKEQPAADATGTVAKGKKEKPVREHKRLVSDEKMEELKRRLLEKMSNLNEGLDMERMLIGAAYAAGKIERGVTKFADFCADMIADFGDGIREYLKLFYNGARDLPEAKDLRPLMDDAATAEEGAEAVSGEPAVSDDQVAGGTQGVDREALRVLFDEIGEDVTLADRMSDYEVEQLTAMIDDWEAVNSEYGQIIEEQDKNLKSKNKAVRDAAKAAIDEAQAKANETYEPIEMYLEELNTKYGIEKEEPFEGAIPTPKIDMPRYMAIRQALVEGYRSGDKDAIQAAAQQMQAYVDEGLDHEGTQTEVFDIAEDYDGNDPEMLADQYIIRTYWDRYLDDDADQEYIKTGLKPEMRENEQEAPAAQEPTENTEPYTSFDQLVADTDITVKDNERKAQLKAIVQRIMKAGSTNIQTSPRGVDTKFVYWAVGLKKAELALLKPWANNYWVKEHDDEKAKTARWVDEREQAIYFIKYTPMGVRASDIEWIIVGKQTLAAKPQGTVQSATAAEPIGKTSSPEEIAQEEAKVDTNPTEGQKEAGNYQKGHINVDGYDITIENPKGSVRSGVDSKGNRWKTTMHNTYGYIRGTEGVDGDHIDVFLSDNPASGSVFVVDQVNPESGAFDEHKVMYGFASEEEAREAYLSNYSEGWQGLGAITEVSREEFKKWVESSHRKTKPFAEYKSVKKEQPAADATGTVAKGKKEKPVREHKRLVSDEKMEELKRRLLEKMSNLNEGLDMERMLIGAAYAAGKIERGVTKFADFCADMIADFGDGIREYLKLFYNGARDLPEAKDLRPLMDDAATVDKFDVFNFDKKGKVPTAIEKAKQVVKEQKVKRQAKKIKAKQGDLFAGDLFGDISSVEPQSTEQPAATKTEAKPKTPWWSDTNRPASIDSSDYRTYMTNEAKEYFANHPVFDGWKRKDLAFVTAAVWDGVVVPYEALKGLPEIVEAEQSVKSTTANGVLQISDEECDQHAKHLLDAEHGSAIFENGKIKKVNGVEDFSGPVRQERKALIIIGYPAAGKSSVFANRLSNEHGARIIDSDTVKPWLEGYDDGNGAGYVQEASSEIAERAIDIAVGKGDNIILPRIGGESVFMLATALKLAGYDVQLYFNDVATVTSVDRATSRFAESGRYLSLDYLTSKDGVPSKNFRIFAEKNIGDYVNELSERKLQELRGRLGRLLESETADGKRLWQSSATDQGGYSTLDEYLSVLLGTGGSSVTSGSGDLIFSYAEWKSNDVAFGEKPKEIWNSKSGQPMPTNDNNNEGEQKIPGESSPVGEGTGQTSRPAERAGAERSSEQNRAERSGSGHSVEDNLAAKPQGTVQSAKPKQDLHKNKRNNVGERGKNYAPTSVKARFNANVEAIKMMRALMEDEVEAPTKDQMEVLRQYSGWGGLGTFFNDESSAENKILRDLLDDEEYNAATLSIKTAYYTPAYIIDSLWDIAKAMGFKGGNVLEGSAGIGNIIQQMPKDMSRQSDIEAVEIDKISGNILKLLYPDANVHIQGFQDTVIRNGSVDLAITNVPFAADLSVIDKVVIC